jgi:AAA15 family ATPase/GTPase
MSFINDIEIKNFKSIRHQKIEGCKRINVFVGPPNVGKSNILEGLGLIGLANDRYLEIKNICRFDNFVDLFNDGESEKSSIISVGNFEYSLKYISGSLIRFAVDDTNIVTNEILRKKNKLLAIDIEKEGTKRTVHDVFDNINYHNVKKYIFKNLEFENTTSAKILNFPYGDNLNFVIRHNKELRKQSSELFSHYNLKLVFSENGNMLVQRDLEDSFIFQIPFTMVADTLLRLIFHKASILSNENTVLLFEEPEANCYEPYIMEITNAIKNDKNKNQFFIVTHSQYVIDELMRDEESRNNTNIYLVGLDKNETKVKLLSAEVSKEAYQTGLNVFFNYQTLWDEN